MLTKNLISLYDFSGQWSQPYRDAGWNVFQVDIKLGIDILRWDYRNLKNIDGILAAPMCTDFSNSGAQYWRAKDADGRTALSVQLVNKTLEIVDYFKPRFWAMENPIGRLGRMLRGEYREGEPTIQIPEGMVISMPYIFNPCDFGGWIGGGDQYTKRTCIWGSFNEPEKKPVEPVFITAANGDRYAPQFFKTGGKSEKTKAIRSNTPAGFAKAFYEANH